MYTRTHTTQALQQAQYQQACDLADEQAKLEELQDDMQEDTVLPLDQQLEVLELLLLLLLLLPLQCGFYSCCR
jgi:hypothetical protein